MRAKGEKKIKMIEMVPNQIVTKVRVEPPRIERETISGYGAGYFEARSGGKAPGDRKRRGSVLCAGSLLREARSGPQWPTMRIMLSWLG